MRKNKFILYEIFLGLGLGFGYLTKLRFFGPIGISELFILFVIIGLFQKFYLRIFSFSLDLKGFLKGYLFFTIFITTPIITFSQFFFNNLNSNPIYILSFAFGWLLCFLLIEAIKEGYRMDVMAKTFAIAFIFSNLISFYFFPDSLEVTRYKGGANNPNQLLYYSSTLYLLVSLYLKKSALFIIPVLTSIMLLTGSDTYILSLSLTLFIYVFLKTFTFNFLSFNVNIIISLFFVLATTLLFFYFYSDLIFFIYNEADEGGSRIDLMYNAFLVSLSSPIFGYGLGSFSGQSPFGVWEAHNTYLDLSMQFGFIFSTAIYFLYFRFLFKQIKTKNMLVAAFTVALIVSGIFHYNARHFTFWVGIAIFYTIIFYSPSKQFDMKRYN